MKDDIEEAREFFEKVFFGGTITKEQITKIVQEWDGGDENVLKEKIKDWYGDDEVLKEKIKDWF